MTSPVCPACKGEHVYSDGENHVCPDCFHEWPLSATGDEVGATDAVVRDANGTPLADGDSVLLIKDLKVKGSSITLKQGTKIKGIRIVDGDHEVDCKTDAGQMLLKACYLRKA